MRGSALLGPGLGLLDAPASTGVLAIEGEPAAVDA
jgi:hypothetical protein